MDVSGSSAGMAVSALSKLETQITHALTESVEEISRSQFLDIEQRSEIYAILETLRTDTDAHRVLVDALKNQLGRKNGDA